MKHSRKISYVLIPLAIMLAGCATKTVVPAGHHDHRHTDRYVVYNVKPAKRHCLRHRGHWHCR